MWMGYENFLKFYINTAIHEWTNRGFKNTMTEYIITYGDLTDDEIPYWLGGEIHVTHRLMLLKKDFVHYSKYFRIYSNEAIKNAQYYWPKRGDIF